LAFFKNENVEGKDSSSPKVNVHGDKKSKPNASSVRSSPRKRLVVVDRTKSPRKADALKRSMSFEDGDSNGMETEVGGNGNTKNAREDSLEALDATNFESGIEIPCKDYETLENYHEVVQNQIHEKKHNLARLLEISSRIRHLLNKGSK
jgi:hypothetical protein